MCTRHFVFGLAMLLCMGVALPCVAADSAAQETTAPSGASAFVLDLAQKALISVSSETLSHADRKHALEEILDKDFDVPQIANFVLGRYWRKATDAEQQTFIATFRDYMVRVYAQQFTVISGESCRIIGEHTESPTTTVVETEISLPDSQHSVRVVWHVVNRDGYRVTDIGVVGISMAKVQRDDFVSFLWQNGGDMPSLIRQMQVVTTAMK